MAYKSKVNKFKYTDGADQEADTLLHAVGTPRGAGDYLGGLHV